MLTRLRRALDANIDYGGAIMGATLLGAVVYWINSSYGASRAAPAALMGPPGFLLLAWRARRNAQGDPYRP